MKLTLRVTAGVVVTSVALLGIALPSGATTKKPTFKIDAIMKNDLKVKTAPATQLNLGGSSFDFPLAQAAESQWNADVAPKTPFTPYDSTKSGTGRANVISGAYNIGFSDFPLNIAGPDVGPGSSDPSEGLGNYVQVPVALGGIGIVYHFGQGVSGSLAAQLRKYPLSLKGPTLGQIFAGKIKNW